MKDLKNVDGVTHAALLCIRKLAKDVSESKFYVFVEI